MIEILKINNDMSLVSLRDGLLLRGASPSINPSTITCSDQSIQALLSRLPSLISDGVFEVTENGIYASLENLARLELEEHDPLETIFNWSQYIMRIQSSGTLGFSDFKLIPRFLLGDKIVPFNHVGPFGLRGRSIVRLPIAQAMAAVLCEDFNKLPDKEKNKWAALNVLYQLQVFTNKEIDIELDSYLASEQVIVPKSIGIGTEDDGIFVTVYPQLNGVPDEEIKKQFLNISNVQDVYDIELSNGRKRVLINPELQKVFNTIKKNGFGLSGEKRETFYRNPRSIIPEDGSIDPDLLDIAGFGPRVKGIGYPMFVRPISNTSKESWFNENEGGKKGACAIEVEFVNGEKEKITFTCEVEARAFINGMKAAIATGQTSLEWEGNSIPASVRLIEEIENVFNLPGTILPNEPGDKEKIPRPEKAGSKVLIIHTNEESIEYEEKTENRNEQLIFKKPTYLRDDINLKDHQIRGVHWLQNLINNDLSRGGLLADEMGLGKTLQLLAFAAWCIESRFISKSGTDSSPYDPILVVAPLILVDVWEQEIIKYFEPSVFMPFEILHGSRLKSYKIDSSKTRELEAAKETLDLDKIRENRLIITNYDTVKNYQFSFAKIPWSLVIIDEAQEIKEPGTAITQALKALNPIFRIASTGTPVETSLSNLWSIMDFVHPGNALGSLSDFRKDFGNQEFDDLSIGQDLRDRLAFNKSHGIIKRRTKKEVLKDLPLKSYVIKDCAFDENQKVLHYEIVQSVAVNKNPQAAALQGLHQMAMLAQHPFLLEDNPFRGNHKDYINASSKLRVLIETVIEIKRKKEKALIFTRSRAMQDILKVVLDNEFSLDVKIINGSTTSRHKYVSNTRTGIIDSFGKVEGFNLLILSPEVAGVGLTIVEANHVIHYGRWWNPAKENQATDRAYRMGQVRPVTVYHLILKDPKGEIETFDEKLHRLLHSREELADNFLSPGEGESQVQDGLAGGIFGSTENTSATKTKISNPISLNNLGQLSPYEFEALSALILSKRFRKVLLTPRSKDGGIDVLGIGDKELAFIQCKHKIDLGIANGEDAIEELVNGLDYYRQSILPNKLKQLPTKLILVLNGKSDKETIRQTKLSKIELIDAGVIAKLLESEKIEPADIRRIERTRVKNLKELIEVLKS